MQEIHELRNLFFHHLDQIATAIWVLNDPPLAIRTRIHGLVMQTFHIDRTLLCLSLPIDEKNTNSYHCSTIWGLRYRNANESAIQS
jgi:hypothetical protein